jgi:hypothetical protein
MKVWSLIGLLLATLVFMTIPVSPQVSQQRGLELAVDEAYGQTYRRARVTHRRVSRRSYRYTRRAVRRGAYVAPAYYGVRRGYCPC